MKKFARSIFLIKHLFAAAVLLSYTSSASAVLAFVMALPNEGQATVAIDEKSKTAFIMDMAKNAENAIPAFPGIERMAAPLKLDGAPLLGYLAAQHGTENLVISCSHPHADHMAGIQALFKNPQQSFFHEGDLQRPRFKTITVIDDGVSNSLADMYESFAKTVKKTRLDIVFKRQSATNPRTGKLRNAFAVTSDLQQEVHIENIIFPRSDKPSIHGRSLITITRLGGPAGHVLLDFDDADSKAISAAIAQLKKDGVTKIDTFIVPHHGSKLHDIEPILALNPTKAIITVDPSNRYGHPSASILDRLMTQLKPENVIFTGSSENVILDQAGLKYARHTAAHRESAALFVADAKAFVLKRQKPSQKRKDEVLLFDKIAGIMENGPPTDIPPATDGGGTPSPKHPSGGPGGLYPETVSRIQNTGSILPASFDAVYLTPRGMKTSDLSVKKIFAPVGPVDPSLPLYIKVFDGHPERTIAAAQNDYHGDFKVYFDSPTGLVSQVHSSLPLTRSERQTRTPASPALSQVKATAPPQGGMVFLAGGTVTLGGDKLDLSGAKVTECKTKICLETRGGTYELPFDDQQLFREVWERVALKGTDAFYLSINPRKKFLMSPSNDWRIPSDTLKSGVEEPAGGQARNDVVTAGDIENSRIGQILWQADVAFKSAGLGVNVITGKRDQELLNVYSAPSGNPSTEKDLSYASSSRWCRMYWTSGAPRFDFNAVSKKATTSGPAVLAQSEAMVLESGELKNYRQGGWCDREKAMAASMQKQANDGKGPKVFQDLRQLSLMQSFSLWARQHFDVAASNFPAATAGKFPVPRWTSGIRSAPETIVQEEYIKDKHARYVHLYANEAVPFKDCFVPMNNAIDEEWERIGLKKDSNGTWILTEATTPVLSKWMSQWTIQLAKCSKARIRAPVTTIVSLEDEGEGKSAFAMSPHVLSSQIHGGILLGSTKQRRPFESAYLPNAIIWAPTPASEQLVFRQLDGDLHFWNRAEDNGPEIAQHIVITEASIKDSYVKNGKLRFLVEAPDGSVVRKELRAQPNKRFSGGVEWIEALHGSDGRRIRQTAAWPCIPDPGTCIGVAEASQQRMYELIDENKQRNPKLDVMFVDTNTWLVELDLSDVEKVLKPGGDATNKNQRIAAAQQLAKWGYTSQAQEILATVLDDVSPTAQDTVLANSLADEEDDPASLTLAMLTGFALQGIDQEVRDSKIQMRTALTAMSRVDQLTKRMSLASSKALFGSLVESCDGLMEVDVKPAEHEKLAAVCEKYRRNYSAKSALLNGIRSELTEEPE